MIAGRMRVFAGPNGSGKTTIFKGVLNEGRVNLGIYVNAVESPNWFTEYFIKAGNL